MLVKSLPVNHLSTTYSLTSAYFSLHDNKIAPPYVVGIFIFHLSLEQTPKPRVCCHILGYKKKEVAQWHLQRTYWMAIYTPLTWLNRLLSTTSGILTGLLMIKSRWLLRGSENILYYSRVVII